MLLQNVNNQILILKLKKKKKLDRLFALQL